jgi:hypothetical protein
VRTGFSRSRGHRAFFKKVAGDRKAHACRQAPGLTTAPVPCRHLVVQPTGPLAIGPAYGSSYVILRSTQFGRWPAPLGKGLCTPYLVRQQGGLQVTVGTRECLAAAAPGPNRGPASPVREANVDNDHVCRVPATQLDSLRSTMYLFRILSIRF